MLLFDHLCIFFLANTSKVPFAIRARNADTERKVSPIYKQMTKSETTMKEYKHPRKVSAKWKRVASHELGGTREDSYEETLGRLRKSGFSHSARKVSRRLCSSGESSTEAGWVADSKEGAGWRYDHNMNSPLWQAVEFGNHP